MCTIPPVSRATGYGDRETAEESNGASVPGGVREDIIRAATRVFSDRGYPAARGSRARGPPRRVGGGAGGARRLPQAESVPPRPQEGGPALPHPRADGG